jgi:SAM-dependent MidA family methyltransferase
MVAGGWLPWAEVMDLALYHPEYGYYSKAPRRIGRGGDFYTAVSVGPLYGRLIAEQVARVWAAAGSPAHFVVAEQAAHDGQLMEDLLKAIQTDHPEMARAVEVVLVEPQEGYQKAQELRLKRVWAGRLRWVAQIADLKASAGFLVCNELLDAFAVHRVTKVKGQWMECGVALSVDESALVWEHRIIEDEGLKAAAARLPPDLPDGFVTEVPIAVTRWVAELGRSGFWGTVWIADYGLDAEDYWSLERPEGTLRRYWEHRMDDRVLEDLGNADLTCHVNFTHVHEAAMVAGFEMVDYVDQGRMLTRLAGPWLSSLEGKGMTAETPGLLRQFQSLTHPGIMGRSFRVMLLERVAGL